ncbi:MAG: anhydro-N-acetylmuramic acid kinase [Methylococcaceae bacterium]
MSELYIGLMSGTSLDGIDAALVDFSHHEIKLVATHYLPFSDTLKQALQQLSAVNQAILLPHYGAMDTHLGLLFAQVVNELLIKADIPAKSVKAIGSHGQTIYHDPNNRYPFSLQIGDANVIAERTGITTIADFRRRDIAAGGQGAPLVPAFHQAVFSDAQEDRCIVNIGGIANVTILTANNAQSVIGFDTGMGNTLMDLWSWQHRLLSYDAHGAWARMGTIDKALVQYWLQDAYFSELPPKSTGKEYFSLAWLANKTNLTTYKPEDIQASLSALTAISIANAIKQHAPNTQRVLICGGGVHNDYLLELLAGQLNCPINSTEYYGVQPDYVEAVAFAWLARQTLCHLTGNLPEVTGANQAVILGGIYQA